ncbi:MAG: hypothetical protein CMO44_13430 [Verrucomicrobiales bacterium]|nr:hypothetical protein [Verrucomicrobiales bacterium]
MKSITCAFGRQSALKNAVQYRPAIDLILPRKNNSTFFTTIINPQGTHENRKFRKELCDSCNGTEPSIVLFGDVFSMSPMLVHSLLLEEVARHTSAEKDLEFLKLHTRCFELVRENEPFVAFRIVRIFKAPTKIEWDAKSLRSLGYEQHFVESLNPRNKIKKSVLKRIKTEILDMMKNNNFFNKDAKYRVNQIFHKARLFNVGILKHRLLEAAKIHIKSESYLKLAVFFLPKYMQYLIDNRRYLDKCLNDLCTSDKPDVVLYEKYPMIWSKLPWVDQVEDTLKFWNQHELLNLGEWQPRFDTFKKVFEARNLKGETVAAIDFELQHVETVKHIIDPDIPRTYNYAFAHEYEAELEFIQLFQTALKKEEVNVELGYQLSDSTDAIVLVPNLSLKRYAALVCYPIDRKNIHVYDKTLYSPYFGNKKTKRIIAFGLDLWAFKDISTYLKGISVRQKLVSKITLHAFADINIGYFTAPRYGLRPWNELREASWFPKIEPIPKSGHLHANEEVIKDFDQFLKDKILDETVMHKKDRLSAFNSYVFMTFSEEDRETMVEELSRNDRFPRSKYKYFVGDRVQTPDGFLTNIKRIHQEGNVATSAWRDNYEQFMIFLENPFNEMETICFHPRELRDAFVMRFHWLRGPLSNIVLCGAWPLYAVEEIRKLCTRNIYFHPNFSELAWQRPQHPRKNCFNSILHEQETLRKRKRKEEEAAQEEAKQAAKKQKLKDIYNKSKALARMRNETTSLSNENMH